MALVGILHKLIDEWVSGEDSRNVAMLSKLSKVPPSTMGRIYRQEVVNPEYDTVVKFINIVTNDPKKSLNILHEYYPQRMRFAGLINFDGADMNFELDRIYQDEDGFLLLTKLLDGGMSTDFAEMLRPELKTKLSEMVNLGIAKKDIEKSTYVVPSNTMSLLPKTVYAMCRHVINLQEKHRNNKDNVKNPCQFGHIHHNQIPIEDLAEIEQDVFALFNKIKSSAEKSKKSGIDTVPFAISMVGMTFDSDVFGGKK